MRNARRLFAAQTHGGQEQRPAVSECPSLKFVSL
jgi:hypothetical protein